jgi:hypothetical protein
MLPVHVRVALDPIGSLSIAACVRRDVLLIEKMVPGVWIEQTTYRLQGGYRSETLRYIAGADLGNNVQKRLNSCDSIGTMRNIAAH